MLIYAVMILTALCVVSPVMAAQKPAGEERLSGTGISEKLLPGLDFVLVRGGCFRMGSDTGNYDEKPVHDVCVSDFYLSKYEVTQGQWVAVMGDNPSRFRGCGSDCPVEQVSSNEAVDFTARLSNRTGKTYRLPTEAEWEYACRDGGKDELYCGGNHIDSLAWYEANGDGRTHPVGQKKPNALGLYDMSGNVWEWVLDWKGAYPANRQENPVGPSGATRVRRGGSWQYGAGQARAAWRSSGYPDDRALDIGFRLVRQVEP